MIKIESPDKVVIKKIKRSLGNILPVNCEIVLQTSSINPAHLFFIEPQKDIPPNANHILYKIVKNGETEAEGVNFTECFRLLESKVRLTVAEYALDEIFLHAGVVEFQNKALIIPGRSFTGKTSLIVELLKHGCRYLSDEYAIIDRQGFIRCFPKKLSVRGIIDDYTQKEIEIEKFGVEVYDKPLRPGWILSAKFNKRRKKIFLKEVSAGEGLLACLDNSISIRRQPKFVLEALGKLVDECIALKAERGEAFEFAPKLLDYLAKNYNKS